MATVGLSQPYYAVYSATGSTVTYTAGANIGKATELSIEIEASDNKLYGDNALCEIDRTFTSGTVTVSTTELSPTVAAALLGVTASEDGWLDFGDGQTLPYVGFGGIIKRIDSGVTKWQPVVLYKVQFKQPDISATTQGESIEWQVQELEGTIMRSDATDHNWGSLGKYYDTEDAAVTALKAKLA